MASLSSHGVVLIKRAKVRHQGITEDLLDRPGRPLVYSARCDRARWCGQAPDSSSRRDSTCREKARRIDEGLEEVDRVAVELLPIRRHTPRQACEHMRGKVRNRHPGQDQEARVVGQEAQVAAARHRRPPDEPIAGAKVAWCRPPREARERAPSAPHEILQVRADRLLIAQVVVLREQGVEQSFVG